MCVWGRYFALKKRGKCAFYRAKTFVLPLFRKTGITLDTCCNFASASAPALKTVQKRQKKAAAIALLAIAAGSTFNAKNFDFERSPSTPRRARPPPRRRASRLRTRQESLPKALCPKGESLCGNRDSSREHRARKRGSARRSTPSRRWAH